MNTSNFFITALDFFSSAVFVLVIIRIILSWIPTSKNKLTQFVWDVTEPMLKPFRKFNPKNSPLDFSPIILIILIEVARNILSRVF